MGFPVCRLSRSRGGRLARARGAIVAIALMLGTACSPTAKEAASPVDAASNSPSQQASATPVYGFRVVNRFPHDPTAFTQGLVFADGNVYEGTGLEGKSRVRRVALESGAVLGERRLPDEFFGEGIAVVDERLVQLTWKAGTGFVYDRHQLELRSHFSYSGEGWGLTTDGRQLIMSDGTDQLRFLDPDTFAEKGRLSVYDRAGQVDRLNELEYVAGEVFANVWPTDRIARISPQTGEVVGWIDLTGLLAPEERTGAEDVLNGIAYDEKTGRLFVTGKLWANLYEITLTSP